MRNSIMGLILILLAYSVSSQTITQKEAKEIFQQTVYALKSYDTASFISLWHLDDTKARASQDREYTKSDVVEDFKNLQNFLVVPLVKGLPFERIEITAMGPTFQNTYKIKAYFKIDERLQLGYGFLTDYVDGRWALRWNTETTISPNN